MVHGVGDRDTAAMTDEADGRAMEGRSSTGRRGRSMSNQPGAHGPAGGHDHVWRLRDVCFALPGPFVSEVCARCGALRIHGPEEITGPRSPVAEGAALHLLLSARRRFPPPGETT